MCSSNSEMWHVLVVRCVNCRACQQQMYVTFCGIQFTCCAVRMCAFSVDDRSLVLAVMRGTRRVLGSAPPRQFENPIELVCFVS